jgi:hypothetical protein
MTAEVSTKQRYHLRLTARHVVYVESGSNLFRDFAAGSIITDPDTIKLLEAHNAPVERVETRST